MMMQRFGGIAADVEGDDNDRSPLVFVHGLSFDRTMWRPALAELALADPRRRVVAVDLPGHGESDDRENYDLDSVVATLHRVVEEACLDAPVVVGHSIGGVIVTAYAGQYPTRGVVNVDQPLFVAPFAALVQSVADRLRGPQFDEVWAMFAASFHTELLSPKAQEIVRTTSRPRQDVVLGYWKDVIEAPIASLTATIDEGLAQLRATKVQYVVVAGNEPEPAYEQWLRARLPDVRVEIWPNSSHFPHLAHPAEFAKILADTATW
jgi:pimeloyl-ACP methyl ester carboxylesterase